MKRNFCFKEQETEIYAQINGGTETYAQINGGTEIYAQMNGDEEMHEPLLEIGSDEKASLTQYIRSIFIMPRLMQILCFTNVLSWMGFVSYALYFTDFVGESVFMGDPMVS